MYMPFYPPLETKMQSKRVSFVTTSIPWYVLFHSFPEVFSLHQISNVSLRVNCESEEAAKGEAESTLQLNL